MIFYLVIVLSACDHTTSTTPAPVAPAVPVAPAAPPGTICAGVGFPGVAVDIRRPDGRPIAPGARLARVELRGQRLWPLRSLNQRLQRTLERTKSQKLASPTEY
ncbi:MAG: hypothetical protein JWM41_503 [Gemmatimonadetes bacterium]|nr:hypothetical protein [Gemmatimonadota bacterium]